MPIKIFLKSTASTSPVLSAASIVAPPALASAPSFNVVHACSQSREGLRSRDPVGSHCLMIVLVEEVEEGFFLIKKTRPAQPQLEGATRRESEREERERNKRKHLCISLLDVLFGLLCFFLNTYIDFYRRYDC